MKRVRPPMKSSKSNNKIPAATNFFWGIHVTTYQPRFVAYLNSFSTARCIIIDIVNLPMSWSIVVRTLQNTYLELAQCQGSSCRLLRHSKISAPVHSLKGNSTWPRVHWTFGTQSVKSLLDIIYSASYPKQNIPCSGFHAKEASHRIHGRSSTWLTGSRPSSGPQNVWHW